MCASQVNAAVLQTRGRSLGDRMSLPKSTPGRKSTVGSVRVGLPSGRSSGHLPPLGRHPQAWVARGGFVRTDAVPVPKGNGIRLRTGAVEQRDAAAGALCLKMPYDGPFFINVRPAADPYCSVDLSRNSPEKRGNDLAHEWRAGLACLQVEGA